MNFTATSFTVNPPANTRTSKRQRWTPSEYRTLYDKLHGTDTVGEANLKKLTSSQTLNTPGDKNKDLLKKRQVLFEDIPDKHLGPLQQKENTKNPVKIATCILYNEVDRKKMLEIFRIRSNKDDDWTTEEANHLMKKWFGPELLWTDSERAIFTDDENWDTADDDFITDEEQDQLFGQLFPYFGANKNRDHSTNTSSGNSKPCQVEHESTPLDESDGNAASNSMTDESTKEDGDSEDTASAVSDDEIDVVNIEKATKKLMGMIAYEKHVDTFMAIDVEEMQKLMFHKMNEDEDIHKVFMQHPSFNGRL